LCPRLLEAAARRGVRGPGFRDVRSFMRFDVGSTIRYTVKQPTTLIVNVHVLRTASQVILEEHFSVEPWGKVEELAAATGENRFVRIETGNAKKLTIEYRAKVDVQHHLVTASHLERVPVGQMTPALISYLFPSRYCQSDQLGRLAWDKFGKIKQTYERVVAVTDWVHRNVDYVRGYTNASTAAYDTVIQRAGVCRDFAHLGIALCRALTIPARYLTAYAHDLEPPDFHALFEAYIGNRWVMFDATRLVPLNGVVRIGSGRDAADAAVATIFGRVMCDAMVVKCVPEKGFKGVTHRELKRKGVSLDAG
jgi:transglutaminase-like putative cysteine protease